MANVKTWSYTPAGTIKVEYTDNHTEVMSEGDAVKAGIIKDPGAAKPKGSTTPTTPKVTPGGYSSGTTIADPFGSGVTSGSNYTVPVNGQQVSIATLLQGANDPKKLAAIGAALRDYGIISKGTKSQQSIINAYTSVLVKAAAVSMDPNQWMAEFKAAGGGPDATTTTGGPSTNISLKTYDVNQIQSIAEQVYLNTVGRKPSAKELTDLTTQLNVKEKATPTKTVSTPNAAGTVTTSKTTGGIDEQQFIQSQVQNNAALQPEVSRMKDINFSSWLDKAMSGGPAAGGIPNG